MAARNFEAPLPPAAAASSTISSCPYDGNDLNQGPGANGDSRRRPRGKRGSPISPGRSSTDNARILWQFHEKITPRSGPCRRLRSPIAPGCFHSNHSDSSHRCSQCNFASFYTSHLRTHLETYTGEKESKRNQCDYASFYIKAI